jgi:hypothetical protein
MFCDCFNFGSCEELAIVQVRRWGFCKGLRVCEELLFGTTGFRKLISLLFAMIFGSQYAPFCCSVGQHVQGFQPLNNLMVMGHGSLICLQCHHTYHTAIQKHLEHKLITHAYLQKVWTTTHVLHKDENRLIRLACGRAEVVVAIACNTGPCMPRSVNGSTRR